ncbi:ATP synthase F1 subunit gamma [Ruficoccus sp. ZRK36]|uniref:ATP synthase F1 subunit gamma n=1 Tax=Ruficoccus sp. ZRK36 TaxID=2866311 RepID=UPI001C73AC6A|nr:ATP synthase F1 subunit gamma [Ruficoccus sp. ZRK36]QYY36619.1 ATP synthase F1 subunit gamma [Ruficoccus sp. ZRK36]
MPSTKEIRGRIKAVKNTGQITRAMQLVAASKMKRAQDDAISGRPYAMLLAEILESVADQETEFRHPLLEGREIKKRGILVISTDKGLCGALNANLIKEIIKIKDPAAYVSIGRKTTQFLSRTHRELKADFTISDKVAYHEIRAVVEYILNLYYEGEIDTIEVLYNSFINTLAQEPTLTRLAPMDQLREQLDKLRKREKFDLAETSADEREFLFEPDAKSILQELPNLFIKEEINHMAREAKASEHSARMVAMKAATDNAKTLVDDLTLEYNKARQAAITQEIVEIAAAAAE